MRFYRRRRISIHPSRNKIILRVVIAIICLVVIVVGTVILGNHLKEKADETYENSSPVDNPPIAGEVTDFGDKTVIQAENISLLNSDNEPKNVNEIVEEISSLSCSAVSFDVRNSGGTLLYDSASAKVMGQENTASLDMKSLVSALHERDVYVVGCFDVLAFQSGISDEMYNVILSYESAILSELFEYGLDEILLFGFPFEDGKIDSVVSYMEYMQEKIPENCRLGISLPCGLMLGENSPEVIKKISLCADFIALDISELTKSSASDVYENTDSYLKQIELYLSRYNMRILIPRSESSVMQKQFDALDANAAYNRQLLSSDN